jgi:hypothetical protein
MLSSEDRRALEEIERHLQVDRALRRALSRTVAGPVLWARRAWLALLLMSLALMVVMAAIGVTTAAVESAGLAVVAGAAMRFTSSRVGDRAARGRVPGQRS